MSRVVEEQFEHGTYRAEFVEVMESVGDDRKTIFLPDLPMEQLRHFTANGLGRILAATIKPIREKYGEEGLELIRKELYEVGRQRALAMGKYMKVDPKDARSLARIIDFEDNYLGIKGEWVIYEKNRAMKREYYCPLADPLNGCPEGCYVLEELERGTFDALGAKVKRGKQFFNKVLTAGDPYCEGYFELEDE